MVLDNLSAGASLTQEGILSLSKLQPISTFPLKLDPLTISAMISLHDGIPPVKGILIPHELTDNTMNANPSRSDASSSVFDNVPAPVEAVELNTHIISTTISLHDQNLLAERPLIQHNLTDNVANVNSSHSCASPSIFNDIPIHAKFLYRGLLNHADDLREDWAECISAFIKFETAHEFNLSGGRLPWSSDRPDQLNNWIATGRKVSHSTWDRICSEDPDVFGGRWMKWWLDIQLEG